MDVSCSVVTASIADAEAIGKMALALTDEIIARTGERHFDMDLADTVARCRRYLASGIYTVLLARDVAAAEPVGFAALCESHALYTEGAFGIVQEFYVTLDHRSGGVGATLLAKAGQVAKARGWQRLELCTPPLPEFERTLSFYERHGFEVTGGCKMKRPTP